MTYLTFKIRISVYRKTQDVQKYESRKYPFLSSVLLSDLLSMKMLDWQFTIRPDFIYVHIEKQILEIFYSIFINFSDYWDLFIFQFSSSNIYYLK